MTAMCPVSTARRFRRSSAAWTRIALRPVEMEPRYWLGSQLLVVYGSPSCVGDTVAAMPKRPMWHMQSST